MALETVGRTLRGRTRIGHGARIEDDVTVSARGCEVLFTSLPGPKEVEAIAREICEALPDGASWFDLSTNSPEVVRRLHAELLQRLRQVTNSIGHAGRMSRPPRHRLRPSARNECCNGWCR